MDPRSLKLRPIDEIDRAAFFHDITYFEWGASGFEGAEFDLNVRFADRSLVLTAVDIIQRYANGGIDKVTRLPISDRTVALARAVYIYFLPIVKDKFLKTGVPNLPIPELKR